MIFKNKPSFCTECHVFVTTTNQFTCEFILMYFDLISNSLDTLQSRNVFHCFAYD